MTREELLAALKRKWAELNTPAIDVPSVEVAPNEHPHAQFGKRALNFGSDLLEGLTSPVGAASTALSLGAGAAGRAGLLGISKGARALEAALMAPFVAQGATQAATAESGSDQAAGIAQALLGTAGMRGATKHSFPPRKVTEAYKRHAGITAAAPEPVSGWDQDFAKETADAYEAMPHAPSDPRVKSAYDALGSEIGEQYAFLRDKAGVQMEPWIGPGQPYANSTEMMEDVRRNNRLSYFPSEEGFGTQPSAAHPLLKKGASGLPINDEFRAVHDYFGHASPKFQFGPGGEFNAMREHASMLRSPEARKALVTETHGQNSWVNAGPHLRRPDGSLPRKGETGFLYPADRPFADQKAGLLPEEMILQALLGKR